MQSLYNKFTTSTRIEKNFWYKYYFFLNHRQMIDDQRILKREIRVLNLFEN